MIYRYKSPKSRRMMPALVRCSLVTIRTPTGTFRAIDNVRVERRDNEGELIDAAESKLPATDHPRDHVRWLDGRILDRLSPWRFG